ncbi:MAG: hypothetical protein ACK4TA_12430 [Saprospiraceae bacterium]
MAIEKLLLPAIIESYERVKLIPNIIALKENDIRNEFIKDFQQYNSILKDWVNNKSIWLGAENQAYTDDYLKRTDIEIGCTFHEIYFVFECKRLSSFESRYICGKVVDGKYEIDGLEKFLHLAYSQKEDCASMVAFIIKGNAESIFSKTKDKAELFNPSPSMGTVINNKCADWLLSFQSSHIRIDKSHILLYHLFFDLQLSSV